MDFVTTDIICVNKLSVQQQQGHYSLFEEKAEQYREYHEQLHEKREIEQSRIQRSTQLQKARARRTGDDKAMKQAASRQKKAEVRVGMYREDGKRFKTQSLSKLDESALRLPSRAEPVLLDGELTLRLPPECETDATTSQQGSGDPLLTLSNFKVGYAGRTVVEVRDAQICAGDRIAVVGTNGSGKTTLVRAMAGVIGGGGSDQVHGATRPDAAQASGERTLHRGCRVALIDQNQLALLSGHLDESAIEFIASRHPKKFPREEPTAVRQHLGRFGITSNVAKAPIALLSGGLRVRVILADAFVNPPDVLMLDEPTNHLDGETILALGNALHRFRGAVLAVSHNCAFLLDVFRTGQLWTCDDGQVSMHVHADGPGQTFADHFERFAEPMVRREDRAVFRSMLKTRAARSAIVVQQPGAASTLLLQ